MIETMAIDDALALEMRLLARMAEDPGPAQIVFWQSNQALVAPRKYAGHPQFEHAQHKLDDMGWPIHTRATGGDVTPQGPGIVNVSLIFATQNPPSIEAAYDTLCAPIEQGLGPAASRGWNPGAFCDGAYNVQYNGLKFAGTAQRLKRCKGTEKTAVLAHALMLIEPPNSGAIAALNLFLETLGERRQIDPACHTGLPPDLTRDGFLAQLRDRYKAILE